MFLKKAAVTKQVGLLNIYLAVLYKLKLIYTLAFKWRVFGKKPFLNKCYLPCYVGKCCACFYSNSVDVFCQLNICLTSDVRHLFVASFYFLVNLFEALSFWKLYFFSFQLYEIFKLLEILYTCKCDLRTLLCWPVGYIFYQIQIFLWDPVSIIVGCISEWDCNGQTRLRHVLWSPDTPDNGLYTKLHPLVYLQRQSNL